MNLFIFGEIALSKNYTRNSKWFNALILHSCDRRWRNCQSRSMKEREREFSVALHTTMHFDSDASAIATRGLNESPLQPRERLASSLQRAYFFDLDFCPALPPFSPLSSPYQQRTQDRLIQINFELEHIHARIQCAYHMY